MIIKEKFELVKDHTLLYNEHSYFFNNIIKEDINNLNKKEIKKKLCNCKYIKIFFKYILEKHSEIGQSPQKLLNVFNNEYGDINLNYELISKEEEKKIIENYKKRNKITSNNKIKIEDVINLKNLAFGAINNYKYHHNIKSNFLEQILNFKINEKNVVSKLEVNFKRKNIYYT